MLNNLNSTFSRTFVFALVLTLLIGIFSIILFRYFLTEYTANYHAQSMLTKFMLIERSAAIKDIDIPFKYIVDKQPSFTVADLSFYWQAIRTEVLKELPSKSVVRHSVIDGDIYLWFESTSNEPFWIGIQLSHKKELFQFYAGVYILIVLVLSLIPSYFFARGISRPIESLSDAAEVIASGGVPKLVPKSWPKEIFRLAKVQEVAAERLKGQSKSKEEMLLGISHDIRTPLTRARLAVDFLEKYEPSLVSDIVDDLNEIDDILSQFISYAREEQNQKEEVIDINSLVSEVVSKYTVIETRCSQPFTVEINPLSIKRLLNNLISNAIKYGKDPISVELEANEKTWSIAVIDAGNGIQDNLIEEAIRPFTTLDAVSSQSKSGLGLAIVDRIVRNNGGTLSLNKLDNGDFVVKATFSRLDL